MSAPADPLNFIPADVFYSSVPDFDKPGAVLDVQSSKSTEKTDPLRYAAHVSLAGASSTDKASHVLVQFVTPEIWRIRYNPKFQNVTDYPDANSRTIVMNSFGDLVDELQQENRDALAWNSRKASADWFWKTTFEKLSDSHWVLTAVEFENAQAQGQAATKLHIFANPFRILATRVLEPSPSATFQDGVGVAALAASEQIIWQTTEQAFVQKQNPSIGVINNVVLNIEKPAPAQYLGFGEQGGQTVLKKPTYMNFFCYDNFNYTKVYGQGALDPREPLYHSTPFYLEMNGTPGYKNVTGLMVDNYSQVAVDLGKNNASTIGVATRFGTFDAYVMTAKDVPRMIWQYTSLVGRPKLKPRFILGHHQGCYGYDSDATVNGIVDGYRRSQIPLDGMHLDVDFQVWNVTNDHAPVFSDFPNRGCMRYDVGRLSFADYPGAPIYRDEYVFIEPDKNKPQGNYNSGYPFHGGVSYGENLGTVGYYPDLNRAVARETWGKQYQELFDNGLEFVWQDMTTPAAGFCYGDMLGFPSRLLMSDDTYKQDPKVKPPTKTAIELWALYSYNLHKATYHGLNKLKGRETKRNFIIGRGSQTGMHRYAGLWTGDNGSSWDFWRISVAQVLALGYSGLTIAGVDMGGFTYDPNSSLPAPRWWDPELLIRWYSGAFLLPWYRNHYNQHFDTKVFQEPWQYTYAIDKYRSLIPDDLINLYQSVEPICKYYVQLRYSLMQVLYDTMFANLINGLPIARAMLITDPDDTTLFNSNNDFTDSQYLLGHNILVCPVVNPGVSTRDVYLPGTEGLWFPSNLRVNMVGYGPDPLGIKHASALAAPVAAGTTISYGCGIPDAINNPAQVAFVTPVYIRGGAIIPQLEVRQSIDEGNLNPPTIHVYPGTARTAYSMFLDDGVSRDSAPDWLPQYANQKSRKGNDEGKAKSKYREVKFVQSYDAHKRTVRISHEWDNFKDASKTVGDVYQLAIWAAPSATAQGASPTPASFSVTFKDQNDQEVKDGWLQAKFDTTRSVLVITVPVDRVPSVPRDGPGSPPTGEAYIAIEISGMN
ncbi:glycosyl hydrolases family 31-domain-containing protein [Microdochium bolleyi]|uniref:alpha-glucosidase n=1 Tax=Microdochium bolleyi TaxID=196109 RepID=A0A136JCI0_9PEZI|nr:glycosyl hydrolases family 31-domain-containing protein [Microdochium bolleyi]